MPSSLREVGVLVVDHRGGTLEPGGRASASRRRCAAARRPARPASGPCSGASRARHQARSSSASAGSRSDHERRHRLAPLRVGPPDHPGVGHRRVRAAAPPRPRRRHVLAAGDDQLLDPPVDVQAAVGVEPAAVARVEPAVGRQRAAARPSAPRTRISPSAPTRQLDAGSGAARAARPPTCDAVSVIPYDRRDRDARRRRPTRGGSRGTGPPPSSDRAQPGRAARPASRSRASIVGTSDASVTSPASSVAFTRSASKRSWSTAVVRVDADADQDRQAADVEERQRRRASGRPARRPSASARRARARRDGCARSARPASGAPVVPERVDHACGPRPGRRRARARHPPPVRRAARRPRGEPRSTARGRPRVERHERGAQPRQRVEQLAELERRAERRRHRVARRHAERRQPARAARRRVVELGVGQRRARSATSGRVVGAGARRGGQPLVQRNYRTAAMPSGDWTEEQARGASGPPPTGSRPATTRTSATRPPTGSRRSRSTGPRCATPSGPRR